MSDYSGNKEQLILEFDWITTLQTRFSLADSTIGHSTVFLINLAKYDVRKKNRDMSNITFFIFKKGSIRFGCTGILCEVVKNNYGDLVHA